jgi:hypothetical protein
MAGHAKLSPSGASRWSRCPASVQRSEGIADSGSKYADEGTAAHFLASHCLENGTEPHDHLGLTIGLFVHPESDSEFQKFIEDASPDVMEQCDLRTEYEVDDEMADEVKKYTDLVRDLVKSTNGTLFVEQRLPIDHITGEEGATGTSDTVIVTPSELIVIDLKYGAGEPVDAQDNEQLIMYGLGALISQPRKQYVGEAVYTMAETEGWSKFLTERASRTQLPNPVAIPGKKQCRWCRAAGQCKEQDDWVQAQVGVQFEDLTKEVVADVANNDALTLGEKMKAVEMVEDWCKQVRAAVERNLLSGVEVEGFKLVEGKRGARQWNNADEVEGVLKSMRLKVEEMYDMKLISPTTAEKVLKETPKRWQRLQAYIVQREGQPSVAPVTDKRPAIEIKPVSFDDFD